MARKNSKRLVSGRPQLSLLSEKGHEIPDPTPHTASLGKRRAASIRDNVIDILRSERWRQQMEESGEETFEEADDFDVDDDFDPSTPYEELFEGEYALLAEARREQKKTETIKARRGRKAAPAEPEPVRKADRQEISDGAAPSPKAQRGAASKEISDGESPT